MKCNPQAHPGWDMQNNYSWMTKRSPEGCFHKRMPCFSGRLDPCLPCSPGATLCSWAGNCMAWNFLTTAWSDLVAKQTFCLINYWDLADGAVHGSWWKVYVCVSKCSKRTLQMSSDKKRTSSWMEILLVDKQGRKKSPACLGVPLLLLGRQFNACLGMLGSCLFPQWSLSSLHLASIRCHGLSLEQNFCHLGVAVSEMCCPDKQTCRNISFCHIPSPDFA